MILNQYSTRFSVLFLLAWLSFASPARSEVLSLQDVYQSLDRSYPLVLGAQKDVQKSQGDHLSAQGGFDPVLKTYAQDIGIGYYKHTYFDLSLEQPTALWGSRLVTGYKKGLGDFAVYDSRYKTFDQGEWRAGLEIPLLRGGMTDERRTRIQSNEVGVQASEQSLSSKQLEVRREAARKYWDWVAAGRKLTVAQELLEIALTRDQALQRRVTHGDAAKIDQTDNHRAVLQRRALLVSASRTLQKATLELSLYYRDEQGNPKLAEGVQLPKEFPILDSKKPQEIQSVDLDQVALEYPETQALSMQLKQIDLEGSLARNQLLPRLDIGVSWVRDFGVNPGTSYIQPTNYPNEVRGYLTFELPLFLRTARGKVSAVTAQQEKLSLLKELTQDRIKTQLVDLSQSMSAALSRIEFIRQEVELSLQLEEAERKRFLHGDSSLLIVNIREQATRDAMNKEIDALSDYFKAKAEYETWVQDSSRSAEPSKSS